MIDYHLHLWPHDEKDRETTIEELASYCEAASSMGVEEIALTEHLFRFSQADSVLRGHWKSEPDPALRSAIERYWDFHAHADLDRYVETVLAAKAAGLPVVLGLEVDYYPGQMDKVARLLEGYPFDVLLGSVHWIGGWTFDVLESRTVVAEWDRRNIEDVWDAYTRCLEELADSKACDVLAHPDLVKIAGRLPRVPEDYYDRMAEAARRSGMAAELSSAGWRKPVAEQYPAPSLLSRFRENGVAVTTASDAHRLADVASRSADLAEILGAAGYESLRAFRSRKGHDVPVLSKGYSEREPEA